MLNTQLLCFMFIKSIILNHNLSLTDFFQLFHCTSICMLLELKIYIYWLLIVAELKYRVCFINAIFTISYIHPIHHGNSGREMKGEGRRVKKKIDWMIKRNKRMQGINANSGLLIKYTEEYWVSEIIDMFVFGTPCTFSLKFLSHYETNVFYIYWDTL